MKWRIITQIGREKARLSKVLDIDIGTQCFIIISMRRIHFCLGLLTLVLLSGVMLASSGVSADNDSVVDEINITVPVSCTLSGTGMNTHNATINNGQYNSSIGETTLQAFCNDNNGFAIYAIGYTDDTDGKNVLTNSTLGSTYDIVTGTATSGNTSNWAMKLSTVTSPAPTYPIIIAGSTDDTEKEQGDPDFTAFQEVPDDYERVAYRTAGTDIGAGAEGTTLKTTYQAYINATQPAGTYTGQVKYTLVHPYSADAYGCNPSGNTIGSIVCMQDISSTNKAAILTSMTEEQQYTLKDKRDNKTYTVAKLKDGNIWMTQNLDLDLDSSRTYTNEDTDLGWNGTSYSTASWTPERSTYTTGTTTWGLYDSITGNYGGIIHPESYDPGDLCWNGTLSDYSDWETYFGSCSYNNITGMINCDESINPIDTYITVSGTPTLQYYLGNYYNWTAAVALNDSSAYTTQYQDVNRSICPAGWTLPKSGNNTSSGSFQYMLEQYGWDSNSYELGSGYTAYHTPMFLTFGGFWYGSIGDVGFSGSFWSPMLYSSHYAYNFYSPDGYVDPGGDANRYEGFSVRCVAR